MYLLQQKDQIEDALNKTKSQILDNSRIDQRKRQAERTRPQQIQQQQLEQVQPLEQRSSFKLGEKLNQDENHIYEYKNYRWIQSNSNPNQEGLDNLRRSVIQSVICSFLNTKGGLLLIGVKDKDCQVMGLTLTRSQRDQYKLLIQLLASQINPQIDLAHNPLIKIDYLPVKNDFCGNIPGNFIIRVVVLQGELDKFYTYYDNEQKAVIGFERLDGRKLTVKYPEFLQKTYQFAKNPKQKADEITVAPPAPITDLSESQIFQQIQPRRKVLTNSQFFLGFVKMDYSKINQFEKLLIELLGQLHIPQVMVQKYNMSIILQFSDQNQLDRFSEGMKINEQILKQFGFQNKLLGGLITQTINFQKTPDSVLEQLKNQFPNIQIFGQNGQGSVKCQDHITCARVFDFLFSAKRQLKKNISDNMKVIWELERLLINTQ